MGKCEEMANFKFKLTSTLHSTKECFFNCRTESAAALEKTLGEEEEGDVRDISNFFQHYISDDLLRILGGYQEHLCSILKELAM